MIIISVIQLHYTCTMAIDPECNNIMDIKYIVFLLNLFLFYRNVEVFLYIIFNRDVTLLIQLKKQGKKGLCMSSRNLKL